MRVLESIAVTNVTVNGCTPLDTRRYAPRGFVSGLRREHPVRRASPHRFAGTLSIATGSSPRRH